MILSIHVPKSGGNSFRDLLQAYYGPRVMLDYGDWAGFRVPEALERCHDRTNKMRARQHELLHGYDVIHGHFVADKYLDLFPVEEFVAFFRDPFQQSVSHYYFLLRNPQREHLEEKMLHDAKMTLLDYLHWDAFYDHQTQYLGNISIYDLSIVGLAEQFSQSIEMFNYTFSSNLETESFLNVNPDTSGQRYHITPEVRKAVEKFRPRDIELYRLAKEIFLRQLARPQFYVPTVIAEKKIA